MHHDARRAIMEKLHAAAERRPLAAQILRLQAEGVGDVSTQAQRTGAKISQVYEARRFLTETGRALVAAERSANVTGPENPVTARKEAP